MTPTTGSDREVRRPGSEGGAGLGLPGAGLGLHPRPAPDPLVVALVVAAVEEVWPRSFAGADQDAEAEERARRAWRFSGRWWTRPLPLRRSRPWVS